MGQDIIPYEPYHPHFLYTLLITVIGWVAVLWFTWQPHYTTPRQRVWLLVLAIMLPLYAEAGSYLIFLVRPEPETLVGYWLSHIHIRVVEPLRIDWFLSPLAMLVLIGLIVVLISISLVRFTLATRRLYQQISSATPIAQTGYAALTAAFQTLVPNHPLPPLAVLEDTAPLAFTTGLFKQRIYLSTGLLELLTQDEVQAVLCHELAHIIRRDNLVNVVVRVARDIAFFLPGSWALWRVMMASEDEACDRLAVELTREPLTLARALVKVAAAWQEHSGSTLPSIPVSAFAVRSQGAVQRVEQMLQLSDDPAPPRRRGARLLAAALLLAAVLPALLGS